MGGRDEVGYVLNEMNENTSKLSGLSEKWMIHKVDYQVMSLILLTQFSLLIFPF